MTQHRVMANECRFVPHCICPSTCIIKSELLSTHTNKKCSTAQTRSVACTERGVPCWRLAFRGDGLQFCREKFPGKKGGEITSKRGC